MDKFEDTYRIESARLKNWNYKNEAWYFITVCTEAKQSFFGQIENSIMKLNGLGLIVNSEWIKTFSIRPDMNLKMGEFVVMPNHFHGMLYIGQNQLNTDFDEHFVKVSTSMERIKANKFGPQEKNLSSVIRGFKSAVTKQIREQEPKFAWQPRFYDRIIRDKKEWFAVANYIKNNPKNWNDDKYFQLISKVKTH